MSHDDLGQFTRIMAEGAGRMVLERDRAIRELAPEIFWIEGLEVGHDFANPERKIFVLNLPNLARLPYAAGYTEDERRWLRELSTGFTAGINATRSSRVLVIDLMCHAPMYQSSIYSGDGFHPNDAGYRTLADLVSAALVTAPVSPPTSCVFMS